MKRETITAILGRAAGIEKKGDAFRAGDGHHVAVYLGEPGSAMVIGGVRTIRLEKDHLEIAAKGNAVYYVDYDAVHAVLDREEEKARAAGSGVGFD